MQSKTYFPPVLQSASSLQNPTPRNPEPLRIQFPHQLETQDL